MALWKESARLNSPDPGPSQPPTGAVISLAVLGALSAGWALFQWEQLLLAHAGRGYFCGIGDFGRGCTLAWDSPLAFAVHSLTGLPIAAWGFVWGLVAFLLPIRVLLRRVRGRDPEPTWTAVLWTALGGLISVVVLAGASLPFGQVCGTCFLTYLLTLVYALSALWYGRPLRPDHALGGAALSAFSVFGIFVLVLIPGQWIWRGAAPAVYPRVEVSDPAVFDEALEEYLTGLSPPVAQMVSDALEEYRNSPDLPPWRLPEPGNPGEAPVRFIEFSEVLCGHCAHLWHTMMQLEEALPPGSFSHELHHYPLDSACNPHIGYESVVPQSCVAARALICMEGHPDGVAFTTSMFQNQRSIYYSERVYHIAEPFISRAELAACITRFETEARLQDDIAWATHYGIKGTPLVLVNGRQGVAFGPFLYAMVLAGGRGDHPAFELLPPPRQTEP